MPLIPPTLTEFAEVNGAPRSETIYLPLAEGIQAKVEIQIIQDPACPTPSERPQRSAPTARQLHQTAEAMLRRVYQFHPID